MTGELFYVDKDGKKQDKGLHDEMLREDDPIFQIETDLMLLTELKGRGDKEGFERHKAQTIEQLKRMKYEDVK